MSYISNAIIFLLITIKSTNCEEVNNGFDAGRFGKWIDELLAVERNKGRDGADSDWKSCCEQRGVSSACISACKYGEITNNKVCAKHI
jgi:hypothetical protein